MGHKPSPIDLDLLTADQVAAMLGSTRSTILQIKHRIGFTKPVKEVFFRFEDVLTYALMRTYKPPVDATETDKAKRAEYRKIAKQILQRLKAA